MHLPLRQGQKTLHGRPYLDDTIKRLVAYAEAGADVLYAPGLATIAEVEAVVKAVAPKPVNVVMGLGKTTFTLDELERTGVKRISLGSTLARVAYGSMMRAAREILEQGTFGSAAEVQPHKFFNDVFKA